MPKPIALMLLAPLVLIAAADAPKIPEAVPDGKPVSCIPIIQIRESRVRSNQVIDFVMSGGKVYRNSLPYSCPELGFEQRFGYATSQNELCSTDIITVLHSPPDVGGASCGLGQFQPVTIDKKYR
ncbi:MAG: hypothetical protein ACRCSO_00920 [Sphingomonas sp.]